VGEAKDAAVFAKHLGLPIAIIDKRRSGDEERAEAVAVIGNVRGKRCLLVADEIATGGTIFSATDSLFEQGARGVSAAVVHPVLSGRAPGAARRLPPRAAPRNRYHSDRRDLPED
jgi:ribose-phosphate pyrophosphokinase